MTILNDLTYNHPISELGGKANKIDAKLFLMLHIVKLKPLLDQLQSHGQ